MQNFLSTFFFLDVHCLDPEKNFCSLATGTPEERRIWNHQAKKLISLCLFLLAEFNKLCAKDQESVIVTSLAMRLVVHLTDSKGWKNIKDGNCQEAAMATRNLVQFMGISESGLYTSIRSYVSTLDIPFSSRKVNAPKSDDRFLITASAITVVLRPLQNLTFDDSGPSGVHNAVEKYCASVLTIPWLVQRLPAVLVRAVRHKSSLLPCLQSLLVRLVKFGYVLCIFLFRSNLYI